MPKSVEDVLGDFIADAPLYQRLNLKAYAEDVETAARRLTTVAPILRYCSHERCKAERPFRRIMSQIGFHGQYGGYKADIITIVYRCTHCDSPY